MEATNYSNSGSRNVLPALLLILVLFAAVIAYVQLGIHGPIKHGVEAAAGVSALFAKDGTCNRGPSIEMKNRYGIWLNLCFHDDGASAWITTGKISDPASREVTTIPREQMSKPTQYLRSVLTRDGYKIDQFIYHGDPPKWFIDLLDSIVKLGGLQ